LWSIALKVGPAFPALLHFVFNFFHLIPWFCYLGQLVTVDMIHVLLWPIYKYRSYQRGLGRNSSVGTANCYGLDVQGIESQWGRDLPQRPDRPWRQPSLLYNGYRVFFLGAEAASAWRWPPTPSSAEIKERGDLYLCSSVVCSWRVRGWALPSPLRVAVEVQPVLTDLVQAMCHVSNVHIGAVM
jgi:hypothetical protein